MASLNPRERGNTLGLAGRIGSPGGEEVNTAGHATYVRRNLQKKKITLLEATYVRDLFPGVCVCRQLFIYSLI